MTAFFTIDNLVVTIANKTLLYDISFAMAKGDYLCVIGSNGAGKSTLLKAIMSIVPLSSGSIKLNQLLLSQLKQKSLAQHISYVPQAHGHSLLFKVNEFIKMARYPYHSPFSDWSHKDQQAFDRAVTITDITSFLERQMQTLSGGEIQRVMIAAALCQQTPLLLLDEPTSFLDPHHQVEVHNLIRDLNQQHNISVIEVSHDLNHACQHSQHILALKQGKTLWYGNSSEFMNTQQLNQLYDQQFVFATHPQTGAKVALTSEFK
ncbi:MAG: ABC transporter ATP-binding protein [Gammaproteobacteria bacterium]|nr:ABC transporter ATP-binding protein [Gammaproteobacteria bacterium]MDT8370455.1 ABC transporter ATP-binding protein [Gammaproteobacteria bacterium]